MLIALQDMPFFGGIHRRNRAACRRRHPPTDCLGRNAGRQQPRQMPFMRALTRSSSEPGESMDFGESDLRAGAVRAGGAGGALDVSGGASRS